MTIAILDLVILVVLLLAAKSSIVIVKQQSVRVVELFGKFSKTLPAGFNFKIPFIERVVGILDLKTKELSKEVGAKSKDNSFLSIPVRVQFQVIPEKVKEAFYTLADPEAQMESYITNTVRSTASTMNMEEVFQNKDQFEKDVQGTLTEKFSGFGFAIVNVLVDNPMPSAEVVNAFNRVIASKRLKEAAENEAEAIRVKTVGLAKAEAESLILKAEAYVTQRKTIASGIAEVADITDGATILSYLVGIDTRDMVREASKNGAVILVPTNYDSGAISAVTAALKATHKTVE